jgi:hypothetical protein
MIVKPTLAAKALAELLREATFDLPISYMCSEELLS